MTECTALDLRLGAQVPLAETGRASAFRWGAAGAEALGFGFPYLGYVVGIQVVQPMLFAVWLSVDFIAAAA